MGLKGTVIQKFGIENLKVLIKFSFGLTKELTQGFADGKISFVEQLGLITQLVQAIGVVQAWPQIKLELKELSAPEKIQLRDYVISEFSLISTNNKLVDAQIKKSLAFAVDAIALIDGFKEIKQN